MKKSHLESVTTAPIIPSKIRVISASHREEWKTSRYNFCSLSIANIFPLRSCIISKLNVKVHYLSYTYGDDETGTSATLSQHDGCSPALVVWSRKSSKRRFEYTSGFIILFVIFSAAKREDETFLLLLALSSSSAIHESRHWEPARMWMPPSSLPLSRRGWENLWDEFHKRTTN